MEAKRRLRLVEDDDDLDIEPVHPIARALGYVATFQNLPDNVFTLREEIPGQFPPDFLPPTAAA